MTREELNVTLQYFYDNLDDLGLSVYAILKNDAAFEPQKIDIERNAEIGLKHLFTNYLRDNIIEKEELSVLNFSTADERKDAVYIYDLEVPDALNPIQEVVQTDDISLLDLSSNSLKDISALVIEIGDNENQLVLYKTLAPISIYGRNSFFLKKHDTRMEQIDEEFLRISPNFQLMNVADKIVVLELEAIEKSFGFDEIIKKEADKGIAAIDGMKLVENLDTLKELTSELRYSKKLARIGKASPVIDADVPTEKIIEFCKSFPALKGKIRFTENEDMILLDTNVSKNLFIKLMMDDFLTSELTTFHYESVAKDRAETDGNT